MNAFAAMYAAETAMEATTMARVRVEVFTTVLVIISSKA
jgi:hypothetical protein